jgi:hypothetical protein
MKSSALILLNTYREYSKIAEADTLAIEKIFSSSQTTEFELALQELYQWFKKNESYESLSSYMVDLLLLTYLLEGMSTKGETYLDSAEWLKIEELAEDDGTEWLNLFVYIADCKVSDIEPEIEDYLYNFLLVEEDDQHMEFEIYESLIELQEMVGYESSDILKACTAVADENMLDSLLPLFLLYFSGEKHYVPGMDPEVIALLKATYACVEEISQN